MFPNMRLLLLALLIFPVISSEWNISEFVEKLNEKRRDFAKNEKIPNMRELVWSLDLAVEVENRIENHTLVDGKDRYYTILDERDFEEHFENFLNDVKHISRGFDGYYSTNSHYLFPFVDKIGCNNEFENTTEQYCFLNHETPMNDLFLFYGEAGTRCEYGHENNNGLCKYTGTANSIVTTTTVTTTTKKSENIPPSGPSSSYSMFSLIHILVLLGFGHSIFN